jgi:hypothetical protein
MWTIVLIKPNRLLNINTLLVAQTTPGPIPGNTALFINDSSAYGSGFGIHRL